MRPDSEDEKSRPMRGAANSETELQADGAVFHNTDYVAIVAGAQCDFVSSLMHEPADVARDHLLPADWIPNWREPKIGMIYRGVVAAVDAGINPTPLAVADMLRRNGIRLPSHVQGELLVYINRLFGAASIPVMVDYHHRLVIEFAVFERARNQFRRIDQMPLQGATLRDLEEVMLAESGSIPAYLSEAIRVVGA